METSNQRPLGELISWHASTDPNRPIYTFEGRTWSRIEFDQEANAYARSLANLGVVAGDRVTLILPNGPLIHLASFAIWKLGATPAPISPRLSPAEVREIVDITRPALIIGGMTEMRQAYRVLPASFTPPTGTPNTPLPSVVSQPWKALTSGGSTGRPKVLLDHRPGTMDPASPPLRMIPNDTILNSAPAYHTAPFCQTAWCMASGGHVIETLKFDPEQALTLIEMHRVRWAYLVPTMMNRIWNIPQARRDEFDLSSLELVVHMAAPCPAWLKRNWIEWLGAERIFEVYAGSESVGGCTITGTEWLRHEGSVGRPNPGTSVRITGPAGEALPPGEVGLISFDSPSGLAPPVEIMGASDPVAPTTYGDLGWLDQEGYLYIADRRTDLIISGGANIYPAEIEAALEAHPAVEGAVVIGLPDDDLGQTAHAIIQLRSGCNPPGEKALQGFLASRLARNKWPRSYEYVHWPLRDESGKVRRAALREERVSRAEELRTSP